MNEALAYFSLGSNLGGPAGNLDRAAGLMEQRMGQVVRRSGLYRSAPWGYDSEYDYLNACLVISSPLQPLELLQVSQEIEREMGRQRTGKGYSDRIIDIDLLFCGELVMDHPLLVLPHPRMRDRRFVLQPLAEIAPELIHPETGLSVEEMLQRCPDPSRVDPV